LSPNHEGLSAGSHRSQRRKGRELALQALYQIEITGDPSPRALDQFLGHFEGSAAAKEFARELVWGVVSKRQEIDQLIDRSTENWKLARLAKVDLVLLRLATYELIYRPEIPASVSLDEAVEIAKRFGTSDSPAFVNGVLDQIARRKGGTTGG
jgi:N utilization substance protein B